MSASIENIKFGENGIIQIEINEGFINTIQINGNKKTSSSVIRREFLDISNQYMKKNDFDIGLQNLSSTDLFDNISVQLINNDKKSKKLKLRLDEKLPNVLRFGLRIDNENFTQGAVDIRNENLFGSGSELGLSISGDPETLATFLSISRIEFLILI